MIKLTSENSDGFSSTTIEICEDNEGEIIVSVSTRYVQCSPEKIINSNQFSDDVKKVFGKFISVKKLYE